MASIKQTISISGGVINYLIAVLYKTTAPGAEVARVVYTSGVSSNPFNFEFTDLDNGTYIIKIHESSDGISLGALRHDYWIDAASGQTLFERKFFTVGTGGGAPNDGDTDFIDVTLDGKTVTGVFKEGFRFLEDNTEWQPRAGGGITLLGAQAFSNGEKWSYEIVYHSVESAPAPNDPFANVIEKTATTTLTLGELNNTILAVPAGPVMDVTLPVLATVAEGKGALIIHDGGSAVNVKIIGTTIRFNGADVASLFLAKGETIKLIKRTLGGVPKWLATEQRGQWERVGHRVGVELLGDNMLIADGTEYDGTAYRRIWDYIINKVPAAQKVDYAGFNTVQSINGESVYTKRGFWAVDLINQKFKTPDLRNMSRRFVKNIGGADADRIDNVPGGYQHSWVGEHKHTGLNAENTSHGASSSTQTVPNVKLLVNITSGAVTSVSQAETGLVNTGKDNTARNYADIPVILI